MAARKSSKVRGRKPEGVRLVPAAEAARRLGMTIEWFEARLLGPVFTEWRPQPGGWRKVFGDEIDLFLDHTDERTAVAAVHRYRRQMGRLTTPGASA